MAKKKAFDGFSLDKDIKKAWVKALKSRKYKQGYGYLKYVDTDDTTRHCCLGVLAEVLDLKLNKVANSGRKIWGVDGDMFNIPTSIVPNDVQNFLTVKNDEIGHKFYQIADWIERNL